MTTHTRISIGILLILLISGGVLYTASAEEAPASTIGSSTLVERFNGYRIPGALYEKIIETLKPTSIPIPEFFTPTYYMEFLFEANEKIKDASGIDPYHSIVFLIGWFSSVVNFLRGLLQII